jgi:hypothetical protein
MTLSKSLNHFFIQMIDLYLSGYVKNVAHSRGPQSQRIPLDEKVKK